MNKRISTAAALATGALVAVVLTPGSAVAASAKSVLLGRINSTTATTSLSNSNGTPLALSAGKGQAPLKVNSSRTVTNLSADRLDGLSSGSFLRSTGKSVDADKLDGLNSTSFARTSGKTGVVLAADVNQAAHCPSGTVLTGGGGISLSAYQLAYTGPDSTDTAFVPNSWITLDSAGGDSYSFAVCYSPSGAAIKGAVSGAAAKQAMASQAAKVQRLKVQRSAR
jgi:hypothetical protein